MGTYIPLEVHRYFDFILPSVKNILLKYEMAIYTVRKDAMQYIHQNLERLLTANRAGVLNNFVLSTTVLMCPRVCASIHRCYLCIYLLL